MPMSRALKEEMREEAEREEQESTSFDELEDLLEMGNIASLLPDSAASDILDGEEEARTSMDDWLKEYEDALKLAKLQPKEKNKTFPFEGASTAMAPFILEAMIDFNARTAPELAYGDNIVKAKVYGGKSVGAPPPTPEEAGLTPDMPQYQQAAAAYQQAVMKFEQRQERIDVEKENRADRVAEYSNYQLSKLMPYWKRQQDKLLLSLPCVGTMYKESYFDTDEQKVCSYLLYGDDVLFDQSYPTFESAPDKYIKMPDMCKNEIISHIRGVEAWDIDEDELSDDTEYEFVKAYTWFDLDNDGLKEPYCAIVCKNTSTVVYAAPDYDEDTISVNDDGEVSKVDRFETLTQFQFIPDPSGGPMGMGWGILLGPMFKEINSNLRRLLDAGTLSNLAANSGLIAIDTGTGRGGGTQKGPIEMAMGKLTPIPTRGASNLSQNVVQFPARGPDATLFQLLEYMVESARRLTDASSMAEANPNEAAALYLARLQQTLKRPNIITMRVYDCAAKEFEKIFLLNHKHYSDEQYNKVIDEPVEYSMRADFDPDNCDIQLVADPSQGSDIERIARAEAVLQNAKTEQQPITDMRQATIDYYRVLGVADPEAIVPPPPEGPDPIEEELIAQKQMEAEFRNREMATKERRLAMEETKMAMESAKMAMDAGLEKDKSEADIALTYAKTLETLAKTSEEAAQSAMRRVQMLEETFINNAEGGATNVARADESNPGANPALGD